MLNKDDLIDIILARLKAAGGQLPAPPPSQAASRAGGLLAQDGPKGRLFLSEYDIRKRLTLESSELRIPKDAIISPLAVDWLTLRRIRIVRE